MLWPKEKFYTVFDKIKNDAVGDGNSCSVLILVAPDVDSLCACHILVDLLKAEMISFSMVPVNGYFDFEKINQERINVNQDLRSLILINCGATVNIGKIVSLDNALKCYILDSHRPIHLSNIYESSGKVIILDDGTHAENLPSDGSDIEDDMLSDSDTSEDSYNDDSGSEAEASLDVEKESTGEDENEDENDAEVGEKRKRNDESIEEDDVADTEKGNNSQQDPLDEEPSGLAEKKSDPTEPENEEDPEIEPQVNGKKLKRGSYNGSPVSTLAFEMASQLNSSHNDKLWLAIVGLTKQLVHQEIDSDHYNLWIQKYQHDVLSLNQHSERVEASDGTIIPTMDDGKISFEEEYRFMLYRHWSLHDSMYYSNFIASKLGIWKADGKSELEVLLARMGYSLNQCKQKYTFMSRELKEKLRSKIQELADDFGIEDVFYGSFRRQFEYQYELCAADVVYSISALLEASPSYFQKVLGREGQDDVNEEVDENHWQNNFHIAYGALSCTTSQSRRLMEAGIDLSMAVQKEIVEMGLSIIERKLIVRVKHFRYACLRLSEDKERIFSQPNTLSKLALFMVDVHREGGKWIGKNACPFILMCRHETTNTFLVVGVTCPQRSGEVHRNNLGMAFKLAASETGARYRHDGFETSVMEIEVEDIHEFVEQLHNVLDA